MPYKIHPACEASPAMSDEEYAGLNASIEKCGLIQPILIFKGLILDGRHRQKACDELGIEAHYLKDDELLETQGDPWEFVWATMQHKRPSTGELAVYSAKWRKAKGPKKTGRPGKVKEGPEIGISGENKNGGFETPNTKKGKGCDEAGAKFGVSGSTVKKASNVLDNGVKKLQEAMGQGKVNVTLAEKVSKLDKKHQEKVVSEALKSENPEKVLKEAVKPKPPESVELAEEVEPAEPKKFDHNMRGDKLAYFLRKELGEWPDQFRPVAVSILNHVALEFRK